MSGLQSHDSILVRNELSHAVVTIFRGNSRGSRGAKNEGGPSLFGCLDPGPIQVPSAKLPVAALADNVAVGPKTVNRIVLPDHRAEREVLHILRIGFVVGSGRDQNPGRNPQTQPV